MSGARDWWLMAALLCLGIVAPFLFPALVAQFAFLWLMVVFALSWDVMGGQMGYNSFGNILFFGIGCYTTAVVQRDFGFDYFAGLGVGLGLSVLIGVGAALLIGRAILGLRGHYFAIGTLGLGIAAAEIAGGWYYIGAGAGMVTPVFPGDVDTRNLFFYGLLFALAGGCFIFLRALYQCRFGMAINAIRDNEDKAEAMGLHTLRYKITAWCVAAFFLALAGGLAGNMIGFIDPRDVAFAGATYGVWMVLMAVLGGKGSLWGPVLGAAIFHLVQELFWTYLLGWQRVALGALIVLIVVFYPQGIMGWLRERRAGLTVRDGEAQA